MEQLTTIIITFVMLSMVFYVQVTVCTCVLTGTTHSSPESINSGLPWSKFAFLRRRVSFWHKFYILCICFSVRFYFYYKSGLQMAGRHCQLLFPRNLTVGIMLNYNCSFQRGCLLPRLLVCAAVGDWALSYAPVLQARGVPQLHRGHKPPGQHHRQVLRAAHQGLLLL